MKQVYLPKEIYFKFHPKFSQFTIVAWTALILMVVIPIVFFKTSKREALVSPYAGQVICPSLPKKEEITERDEIKNYIQSVFGSHTSQAMRLLTDPKCHENLNLDPKIKHENKVDGKVSSIDYGLFQINGKWQGISHEGKARQFLLDYKINTQIAWRLYEDNNYSFSAWSCGRALGI